MARICPLFSGSTGNSTYIGTAKTGLLIDAGASCKGITEALRAIGTDICEIGAIAVTHCHEDHIKGLKTLLKRTGAKLIATKETAVILAGKDAIPPKTEIIIPESSIAVGDCELKSFPTSHDIAGSCGYSVTFCDGKSFTLCTDTGIITEEIQNNLLGSDCVLLESNHDMEMLKKGPYPPLLKVRIMSETGHISNSACAGEVKRLYQNGTQRFILGHLSLNNNTPLLAKETNEAALMDLGAKNGRDYILNVANVKNNGVTVL